MKDFGPFNRTCLGSIDTSNNFISGFNNNLNNDLPYAKPEVFNPTSYQEANMIADCMIENQAVIVNLELMLNDESKKQEGIRIIDYLCGVAYCLKINVVKINVSTFYFSKD